MAVRAIHAAAMSLCIHLNSIARSERGTGKTYPAGPAPTMRTSNCIFFLLVIAYYELSMRVTHSDSSKQNSIQTTM